MASNGIGLPSPMFNGLLLPVDGVFLFESEIDRLVFIVSLLLLREYGGDNDLLLFEPLLLLLT